MVTVSTLVAALKTTNQDYRVLLNGQALVQIKLNYADGYVDLVILEQMPFQFPEESDV